MNTITNETEEYFFNYTPQSNVLKFIWKKKHVSQAIFQSIITKFSDLALEHRPKFLYVDARENTNVMSTEIQKWHDETIIPKYNRSGAKKMAFLIPLNIFSEITHKQTFEKENASKTLETKFFKSHEEILAWFGNISA